MVIYFADHLAHSIQIDAISRLIEHNTRRTIIREDGVPIQEVGAEVPEWAVPLLGKNSGYIQTVHPQLLLPLAAEHGVTIGLRHRVGQHVVAGTVLGWVSAPSPDDQRPNEESFEAAMLSDVRVGFERTIEQDIGFGIRHLAEATCEPAARIGPLTRSA
jgi:uncharacterized membrane protein